MNSREEGEKEIVTAPPVSHSVPFSRLRSTAISLPPPPFATDATLFFSWVGIVCPISLIGWLWEPLPLPSSVFSLCCKTGTQTLLPTSPSKRKGISSKYAPLVDESPGTMGSSILGMHAIACAPYKICVSTQQYSNIPHFLFPPLHSYAPFKK